MHGVFAPALLMHVSCWDDLVPAVAKAIALRVNRLANWSYP